MELRKYRWSRAEVSERALGCAEAVPKMKHQAARHGKGNWGEEDVGVGGHPLTLRGHIQPCQMR